MGTHRTLRTVQQADGPRRRDPQARERILSTTLRLLREHGYQRLTIDRVAATAGVGKATVYRWWPNKAALVLGAVHSRLRTVPTEDVGDSRAELLAVATQALGGFFGSPEVRGVLPALIADMAENPELRARLADELVAARREQTAAVLRRAIDRGDLPEDTDVPLVQEMWAGSMLFRALFSHDPVDDAMAARLVDSVLSAPPRLPGGTGR